MYGWSYYCHELKWDFFFFCCCCNKILQVTSVRGGKNVILAFYIDTFS